MVLINISHHKNRIATLKKDKEFVLEYHGFNIKDSISLSLPNSQKFYISNEITPYFETFLPEGYLFEIFKNHLTKEYGYIDDFLLFKILSPNIEGRICFEVDTVNSTNKELELDIENILANDTRDTFNYLLQTFLDKNAISGVQPKTLASLRDKESLHYKDYIIKTWGEEFKYLAENEYLTLKTIEFSGLEIPNLYLSKNKNFLIIERFDSKEFAFEELISLFGKHKNKKYSGSYEQVAKLVYKYVNEPTIEMKKLFKLIIMNYLLKNGDAHLKNFGLLFSDDFSEIKLSPVYDVVTTTAYIYRDKPALTLNGKKIWHSKKSLINFGIQHCYLSPKEVQSLYDDATNALKKGILLVEHYISNNPHFQNIGKKMIDSWTLSLDEKEYKEIPLELIRDWQAD